MVFVPLACLGPVWRIIGELGGVEHKVVLCAGVGIGLWLVEVNARCVGVYDVWHIRQPPRVDGLSWPALLHGVHAGTELACLSYVTEAIRKTEISLKLP